MNFEDLQRAWQSQDAGAKVTINSDVLLKEVRRNQQHFRRMIFLRDAREVVVCYAMTVYFSWQGLKTADWTQFLVAFSCFGVGTFMLVDRYIQHGRQPAKNDSLQSCIEGSLLQVNHQIWLLRNVFWWYLLPLLAGLVISTGVFIWNSRNEGTSAMFILAFAFIFVFGLTFWFVYWLNQRAVRKQLEPRRQELETLLAGLK